MDQQRRREPELLEVFAEIGRIRALTAGESLRLEQAIRRAEPKGQRSWTPKDERILAALVLQRVRVPEIAIRIGRTERAVWKKLCLLRKAGKVGYFSPVGGTGRYSRERFKSND